MQKRIRVLLLGHYFGRGGAGRAFARIYAALKAVENQTGLEVEAIALRGDFGGEPKVDRLKWTPAILLFWFLVAVQRVLSGRFLGQRLTGLRSNPVVPSPLLKQIQGRKFDVINLHWLGDATLSIEQIGLLQAPLVWTLHDMWPYSGDKHMERSAQKPPRNRANRGLMWIDSDRSRRVLERKQASWADRSRVVAPSSWAARNAAKSSLFADARIHEIPPPIDLNFWSPASNRESEIPPENRQVKRVAFPLFKGPPNWVKGGHLVPKIVEQLSRMTGLDELEIWLFGGGARNRLTSPRSERVRRFGHLDDVSLRNLYRQVDVVGVPSLNETFGLVAQEAQACGTPVVGFSDTGMESIVDSGLSGLVVEHGNVVSFVAAVRTLLDCPSSESSDRALRTRERAETLWPMERIGALYADVLRDRALSRHPGN